MNPSRLGNGRLSVGFLRDHVKIDVALTQTTSCSARVCCDGTPGCGPAADLLITNQELSCSYLSSSAWKGRWSRRGSSPGPNGTTAPNIRKGSRGDLRARHWGDRIRGTATLGGRDLPAAIGVRPSPNGSLVLGWRVTRAAHLGPPFADPRSRKPTPQVDQILEARPASSSRRAGEDDTRDCEW